MSDEGRLKKLRYFAALRERVAEAIDGIERGLKEIEGIGIDLSIETEKLRESHNRMLEKLDAQITSEKAKLPDA